MNLTDNYDGSGVPFEGDQTLQWSSLPAGAKLTKATITLKSVPPPNGTLFSESIKINGTQGDWGATALVGTFTDNNNAKAFVEIDFHRRRTLISVDHSGLTTAALQIDVGGMYVKINSAGAIASPGDKDFSLPADGALPSLTVSKFRLITDATSSPPAVSRIVVRSVPSNLSVKLGKLAPVWNRLGDLTDQDTSPDFSDLLQKFLISAESANGFNDVPVVVHSDTIARLQATVNVEYLQQASVLPDGVKEVVLPFDFGSTPKADPNVLTARLPPNARITTQATSAKVLGSFAETRVLYGPTGDVAPAASVPVAPNASQAQPLVLNSSDSAASLDLLVAPQAPGVTIAIDLRADLDGKPESTSLFGTPAMATIVSQANGLPTWVNVPFAQPFQFQKDKKYWLVIQSLQGTFAWSIQVGAPGSPAMQHTQDGGLSWRETPAPASVTPPCGYLRLRQVPATFKVPIDLQVGSGAQAQRVGLSRFQPLGRVDFDLGIPEVAHGFNTFLTRSPQTGCVEAEHLANGDFEQWVIVGNDPGPITDVNFVPAGAAVHGIAISPDGKNAYIAASGESASTSGGLATVAASPYSLLTLDVACHTVVSPAITWKSVESPSKILLHPDGTKMFILAQDSVRVADLESAVVAIANGATGTLIKDLCVSSDGVDLYVLSEDRASHNGSVSAIAVDTFAKALTTTKSASPQIPFDTTVPVPGQVSCLTTDSKYIYVVSSDANQNQQSSVNFLNTQTLAIDGAPVSAGINATSIAVTPDGSQVVVGNELDKSVTLINVQSRTTITLPLTDGSVTPISLIPKAIAVSPDGSKAHVALQGQGAGSGGIGVIDLLKKKASPTIAVPGAPASVAITPQGDELFFGGLSAPTLQSLLIGSRIPADWFVTSGSLRLLCSRGLSSAHIVAVFGETAARQSDAVIPPSAFSQVVPITAGCTYLFSFEGLTSDPDAVAEILWRGGDCKSPKKDSLPIPQVDQAETGRFSTASRALIFQPIGATAATLATVQTHGNHLIKTGGLFKAPDGTTAAEVRFVAPNNAAVVAAVSLMGSGEAAQNGTLQSVQLGVPDQWQRSPADARSFLVTPLGSGTLLRNNGPNTTSLVQAVPVTSGKDFTLVFVGRKVAGSSDDPVVELHWLKDDGTEASTPTSEKILTPSFETHPISGKVPDGVSEAEIRLVVPTRIALAVSSVSLHFPQSTAVPISFVAQSPGELRISAAQIGYDTGPPVLPPTPPTGLCPPTPPGQQPGQQSSSTCYCPCCKAESKMTGATPAVTPACRPMVVGTCADCGNQVVRGGGPAVAAIQPLTVRVASHVTSALAGAAVAPLPAHIPVLTDIIGIGRARARHLRRSGIKTVADLATADASFVAQVLTEVSAENAAILIEHAQRLQLKHS